MDSRLDLESLAARAQQFSPEYFHYLRSLKLGTATPPSPGVREYLVEHVMIEPKGDHDELTDAGVGLVKAYDAVEMHRIAHELKD